ncbi:MAG: hypothetical protein GXP63_01770 [DPANN group archaeon]|nr:hypothetical protein [DPANN group archaeon]
MATPMNGNNPPRKKQGRSLFFASSRSFGRTRMTSGRPLLLALALLLIILSLSVSAYPPIATEFYGNVTENGSVVSSGTMITAYDGDGVLCGSFTMVHDGYFGLLSCNGDDAGTSVDEGAVTGENITFFIDGNPTRRFFNFTWISAAFQFVSLDRNYPPVLSIDDLLNSTEDVHYTYDVNATDPNDDPYAFSSNATFFTIDPLNGLINFTPTNDDVGVHSISVVVTDAFGLTDSKNITFIVVNVNDRPFFDPPLENRTVRARDLFIYDINATDIDVGDTLTYFDNSTLFNISPSTGLINFTPADEQIGNHSINITACDDSGSFDNCTSATFLLTILFSNHPPILSPIGNQEAYVGLGVHLDLNATDADNDTLTFFTNSSLFTIDNVTGVISFVPSAAMEGQHSIILGVTDTYYNVTETIVMTIFPALVCGDDICSSVLIGESCYSCPQDCGTCPPGTGDEAGDATGGVGGDTGGVEGTGESQESTTGETSGQSATSASGSKGAGIKKQHIPGVCVLNWTCTDWGPCTAGSQDRLCTDSSRCDEKHSNALRSGQSLKIEGPEKPEEVRACVAPTCSDGIQNQGEEGIDCGGPCAACLIAPITQYPLYPFLEHPGLVGCGDGICSAGEGCGCMQDCRVFPLRFFRYFALLFLLLFLILLVMNYTLYRLGVYRKGRLEQRAKRLTSLLGFLLFILSVFSLYLWLYGSCLYVVQRLIWLPLFLILVIPLLFYELLLYFGYVESRKVLRMKHLLQGHADRLAMLRRMEETSIREVEVQLTSRIYDLFRQKDELLASVQLTALYNELIRLAKHRVQGKDVHEAESASLALLTRILDQGILQKIAADREDLRPLVKKMGLLRDFFIDKRENEKALERMRLALEVVQKTEAAKRSGKKTTAGRGRR